MKFREAGKVQATLRDGPAAIQFRSGGDSQEFVRGSQFAGEFIESLAQARRIVTLKQRKQFVADAAARIGEPEIGTVSDVGLAERIEIAEYVAASQAKKWTEQASRSRLSHARRSGNPAPA